MATTFMASSVETPSPKQVLSETPISESRDGGRTASASASPSAPPEVNVIHIPSHSS